MKQTGDGGLSIPPGLVSSLSCWESPGSSMPGCSLLEPCTHSGPSRCRSFPPLQCKPAQCPHLLLIRYGLMAAVADPHFKLEAHQRDGGALGAALPAHGFPTLPAVMLQETTRRKTSQATNPGQVTALVHWLYHLTPASRNTAQLCLRHLISQIPWAHAVLPQPFSKSLQSAALCC